MATLNRDLLNLKTGFVSQIESGNSTSAPAYISPYNKTSYIKKITITNNTSTFGNFSMYLYENSYITSGNVFLAVASTNTTSAIISTNGVSWTTTTLPLQRSWKASVYGNGKFVAIAGGATQSTSVVTSTNGITWSIANSGGNLYWNSIAYGGGRFVTTANSSWHFSSSTDGVTWNFAPLNTNYINNNIVTYGKDRFVTVSSASSIAHVSTDGISWSQYTTPSTANLITYGNGLFVAIKTNSSTFIYSTDGIVWNSRSLPLSTDYSALTFGGGLFMALGTSLPSYVTSPDGITWTQRTHPTNGWGSVIYGESSTYQMGVFVTIQASNGGSAYFTYNNGTDWFGNSLPINNVVWSSLAYPTNSYGTETKESVIYKSIIVPANSTLSIPYEIVVPPTHQINVRSTVPMQVTINGER